jgi:hypothetical protein
VAEARLAHQANRHDASGHAHVDSRILQLLGGLVRILVARICGNGVGEFVFAAVRGLPQRLDLLQLLAPQFVNVLVECQE